MEYLDFSSVITTIRNYISDAHSMNQIDMMYQLFVSFLSSDESLDFDFDNGLVCRWFNGQAKISPRITRYYMDNHNRNRLAADMHRNVLPLMYDSTMAVQEIYNILVQDTTISDKTKARLLENYPCETEMDEAVFLTSALCFGMERTFVKRDVNTKNLLSAGNLSPAVKDFIYDGGTPKPCRHFCGRDNELVTLHQLLCSHGKVFLQGIAGIGKSELAKAYAKIHSKEYTNILYLSYTGNLKQDISDMDFADDLPDDDNEERFRKHNRFLRTLKEDTLFIIDNFNTTASQDGLLSVVMKYRCRILFTTRSSFNNYSPDNGKNGHNIITIVCRNSNTFKIPISKIVIYPVINGSNAGLNIEARPGNYFFRKCFSTRNQAQCALKREWANQSDGYDAPKQNIDPFGSFLQNESKNQHNQDKPACRYAHVDDFQKEFVHCEPPFLMRSIMCCISSSSSSDIA